MTKLQKEKNVSVEDVSLLDNINEATKGEGWAIFESFGDEDGFRLERLDMEAIFETDDEAARFVIKRAIEGSQVHKDAIYFIGKYGNPSEREFMLTAICDRKFGDLEN